MSIAGIILPPRLVASCREVPERLAWLGRLPSMVREAEARWSLELGAPYDGPDGGAAWVAPARRRDGSTVVLKIPMPHMEGAHELAGLRAWRGDGIVRLAAADEASGAMLLERCVPGTPLRDLPEGAQDEVIARLLRRLWRVAIPHAVFRPLTEMTRAWAEGARRRAAATPGSDRGLLAEALDLFERLPRTAGRSVLLHTDLHAGNVLRAEREPWLAIDPKPFVGDPAYDATQHLLNTPERLRRDPSDAIVRLADLLEVDAARVRLWTFARLALGGLGGSGRGASVLARRVVE